MINRISFHQNNLTPSIKPNSQPKMVQFSGINQNTDEKEISRIADKVSKEKLEKHLNELAGPKTEGRGVGYKGIEIAKRYISKTFREYGLKPVKELGLNYYYEKFNLPQYPLISRDMGNHHFGSYTRLIPNPPTVETSNVLGMIRGTEKPDEFIIISAHYDHMGKDKFKKLVYPGANDDASGVVSLMEIARIMSQEKPPKKSVIFAALSGEESGLLGSKKLSQDLIAKGIAKKAEVLNLEMLAAEKGETLDIWDQDKQEVKHIVDNIEKAAKQFGVKTNLIHDKSGPPADSREFNEHGVPAVTAIWDSRLDKIMQMHPTLHSENDTPENANMDKLHQSTKVLAAASYLLANEETAKSELAFTSNRVLELEAYKQRALNLKKTV